MTDRSDIDVRFGNHYSFTPFETGNSSSCRPVAKVISLRDLFVHVQRQSGNYD